MLVPLLLCLPSHLSSLFLLVFSLFFFRLCAFPTIVFFQPHKGLAAPTAARPADYQLPPLKDPPPPHTLVHEMHAKCVVTTRRGAESISAVPRGAPIEGKAWGQGGDNKQNKTHKHEDNRPRNSAPIAPSPKHMPSARHLRSRPLSLGGYHAPTKGDRRYDLHDLWQRGEVSEFRYHV